jgi:hypothetical protein
MTKSKEMESNRRASTFWIYPLYFSLFFVIVDFAGYLVSSSKLNYFPLVLILIFELIKSPSSLSIYNFGIMKNTFIVFLVYASFLSTYMKIILSKEFSYMSMFLPAIILLFSGFIQIRLNSRRIGTILFYFGLVFEIECVLTAYGLLPTKSVLNFSYEKLYIPVLSLVFAFIYKKYLQFLILLFGYGWNFALYPAASYIIPILVPVGLYFFVKLKFKPIAFICIVAIFLGIILTNIFLWGSISNLSQKYYDYVGKTNNNEFRFFLLKITISKIKENLWFGTLYRGEPFSTSIGNANLVSHNDYINMVLGGGLVCLALFVLVISWIVYSGLKCISVYGLQSDRCKMIFVLTCSFLSILILSNFSALLSKPNNSFVFYALGSAILALSGIRSTDKKIEMF